MLEHKGYVATVERFIEAGSLQAKAINVDSMLAVGASDLPELAANCVAMIDDYLEVCAEFDEEPETSAVCCCS